MQRVGMNQHRLNQDELLRISRAISDTTRYALLEKIYFDQEITVGELCAESSVSAATVAHHIKILNDASLIQVRRQGRYRLLVAQGNTWETYLAASRQDARGRRSLRPRHRPGRRSCR
jgi:DNA-binding transcriptional ArsR family regulator